MDKKDFHGLFILNVGTELRNFKPFRHIDGFYVKHSTSPSQDLLEIHVHTISDIGSCRDGDIRKSRLGDSFKINPDSLWLATVAYSLSCFMRMLPAR